MEVIYSENAQKDLDYWKNKGTDSIKKRITMLIESIEKTPFSGIGKPEPLRYSLAGKWSRRINGKNRLVYNIIDGQIRIYSLRDHYSDK
ncbi:MAG: Txe/YoeB family addiction module toxin [Tannerella sp.]|jgi:toxin YoeB|nr:Txe/YoeB family addiction module toxin [Tannerella sp.]